LYEVIGLWHLISIQVFLISDYRLQPTPLKLALKVCWAFHVRRSILAKAEARQDGGLQSSLLELRRTKERAALLIWQMFLIDKTAATAVGR